jgi:PAS domain S-box-containing protein
MQILKTMWKPERRWWSNPPVSYGVAIVSVTAALISSRLLGRYLATAPVSLFLCAVMFSAWFGGLRPGLLATALSVLAFAYYFTAPVHSLIVDIKEVPRLLIFALSVLFVGLLSAAQRIATESLRHARDRLDGTVKELERINQALHAENAERNRAQEALRESEQRLQDVVDNTAAVVFVKDLELRYILINREFERRFQVQRDQIREQTDFDVIPHDVAEFVRGHDRQVIEAGVPLQFEEIIPSYEGDRYYVAVKFLLRERTGKPYAVCGIATDITERKQAEEALRQAQAELARVSRVTTMEQLAASIAHEVNQPLAAVVTSGNACLNWLATSPPNLRKARDAIERIVRDGNRAGDVLKRVRALVKKAPLTKSVVSVNEVIREVLALAGGELRRHRVETSTELDFNLPSVMADFVQLQQVLLNLVMNAIESMTTITDRPRVLSIQSLLHDLAGRTAILVAVRDSGVGLSPEGIARVFEGFYTTKPEGMGMGLWICRSIIEAHGGQLTAEPNDGRGATFQFVLPAAAGRTA